MPNPDGSQPKTTSDAVIDKYSLEKNFLIDISRDVRKEVLKTRFINGLPSVDTQMGNLNQSRSKNSLRQDNNIQGILDLVVTNDDLLNKFYDIVFNSENQALKLPNVHRGDNKT